MPRGGNRVSGALTRMAERGMTVSPNEIRAYQPTEMDLQIAESMLSGNLFFKTIAEDLGTSPSTVSQRLKCPILCGWISERNHALVSSRLGMIDSALLHRALGGCTRAAEILYKRYDAMAGGGSRHLHVHSPGAGLQEMTDDQLDALLARQKELESGQAPEEPPREVEADASPAAEPPPSPDVPM